MSWTDKKAVKAIKEIRDKYKVKTFIETGTYKGINARLHSKNFEEVYTVEKVEGYWKEAYNRLQGYQNVYPVLASSPRFLKSFIKDYRKQHRKDTIFFYLDAHFYDPKLPKNKRFVVLDELKALKGFKNCVICIHDFDNGLGHIKYDGISLNMKMVKKLLLDVNPNFQFYTNELASCDIVTPNIHDIINSGLEVDKDTIGNINYAWKEPRLTYRGILYALPTKLSKKETEKLGLKVIE